MRQPDESHPVEVTYQARRGPSRGFWIGMLGVVLFALALTFAGAVAAARNPASSGDPASPTPFPTVVISHGPHMTTPPDNFALNG